MATQVGSLYTSLTLESSSFLSNAKRVATATEQMSASIDKSLGLAKGAVVGFVAALSVDTFVNATRRALDYAGGIGETAQQLGVSTKALQEYGYAATQVGISQESLETGLAKLTRSLGEARDGGKKQVEAFAALGVTFKELQTLTPDAAFREVAKGLSAIQDPARRATLEVDLFGKSGQKLDTLLAGGIGQIDELARAANELGVVLSDEQIQKADETADKLSSLNKVLSANIAGIVADNADSILRVANAIASVVAKAGDLLRLVDRADRLKGLLEKGDIKGLANFAADNRANDLNTLFPISRFLPTKPQPITAVNDNATAAVAKTASTKTAKAPQDAYKGFSAAQVRGGALDTLQGVLGGSNPVSQGLQDATTSALDYSAALRDVGVAAQAIPDIGPLLINAQAVDAANSFSESLSKGLGQAIIYGQSLGDALTNSIKAAAAELITSGLLDLLRGGKDGGGGLLGGIIKTAGAIFGGGKAGGGSVKGGMMYDVGEHGRERFIAPANGQIIPADILKRGTERQRVAVAVDVNASPLLVATVVSAASQAAQGSASEQARQASRPRLAGGLG